MLLLNSLEGKVKYLFLLLFSLSLNLVAYEIDPCGNKWTKVVKHFKNLKSQQKFVDKYNKSNKWICADILPRLKTWGSSKQEHLDN